MGSKGKKVKKEREREEGKVFSEPMGMGCFNTRNVIIWASTLST